MTYMVMSEYSSLSLLRHVPVVSVLRPSTRLLCKMYYSRGPSKIWYAISLLSLLHFTSHPLSALLPAPTSLSCPPSPPPLSFPCSSHLRYDTVAQMLTLGNVKAHSNVVVMETCQGLLLGAVLERMGGKRYERET